MGLAAGLRRQRRNAAVCRSQRRTSHDRAAVSGGKGRCKESTHHVTRFTRAVGRSLMLKTRAIERVFWARAGDCNVACYGRNDNDLQFCISAASAGHATSVDISCAARPRPAMSESQPVDEVLVCRGRTTGDDASHQAPARARYTKGVFRDVSTASFDLPSGAGAPRLPTAGARRRPGSRSPMPLSGASARRRRTE